MDREIKIGSNYLQKYILLQYILRKQLTTEISTEINLRLFIGVHKFH